MINIVVADDDKVSCKILAEMLSNEIDEISNVYTAKNGREVLEIIKSNSVDIVISDVRMPIMDGISLCREIRMFNDNIKIILVSAYMEFDYAREAMRYDVSDYIVKPVDRNEFVRLKEIIYKFIDRKKDDKKLHFSLHTENVRVRIKELLRTGNIDSIYEMLDGFFDNNIGNLTLVKELILSVVDGIFDYESERGFVNTTQSKEKVINTFIECGNAEECILLAGKIVADLTQFDERSKKTDVVEAVKRLIDSNYTNNNDTNYNVNELAVKFGVSRVYLSAEFKRMFNTPLKDYILENRMKYAKKLLADKNYSLNRIAELLGYSGVSGFKKMFKKYTGMQPGEYREKL